MKPSVPTLVFVESNTSGTGELFMDAARAAGLRPVLLTSDPGRYSYIRPCSPDVVVTDTGDKTRLMDTCGAIRCSGGQIRGVWSSSEYFIPTSAWLARRLGLPGPDPAAVKAARSKTHQRQSLAGLSIGLAEWEAFRSPEKAAAAAHRIDPPMVVKPSSASGSIGVIRCDSAEQAALHAALLLRDYEEVIVERLISGPEFSVEVFHGKAIIAVRKHLGPLPHFVETGHDAPADLGASESSALCAAAELAIAELGLTWGPAHVEVRMAESGPKIIEVNPRLAGGFIPSIVRLATGIDLVDATVRAVAGEKVVPGQPAQGRHASIRFILASGSGMWTGITNLPEVAGGRDVADLRTYVNPGTEIRLRGDFRDRVGHVIAVADTALKAAVTAEHAVLGCRHRVVRRLSADRRLLLLPEPGTLQGTSR